MRDAERDEDDREEADDNNGDDEEGEAGVVSDVEYASVRASSLLAYSKSIEALSQKNCLSFSNLSACSFIIERERASEL